MFNKILIANRGEIARRIIKSAHKMGIATVAIYSTADSNSPHVHEAMEAYCVGDAPSALSYLNIPAIIEVAKQTHAEAIHPGYGFLSENAEFAKACQQHQLVFIGPDVESLEIMGSKQLAKKMLEKSHVPLTPGYHGQDQNETTLLREALKIGFPILIKAANGGGGKGMRVVLNQDDFQNQLIGAKREAKAYFADETVILEKLVTHPRHIEVQILADHYGKVLHVFERDCSIQRRHQKIIEEAPAPNLAPKLRENILTSAISVAKAIHYKGAGTIEFLVSGDEFYFMEMNTRLQVEHPVTEMVTGLDLVELQIRIAANEPMPLNQEDIKVYGHAIECRIYAEDPEENFLPSIGQINFLKEPQDPNIRIDSAIQCNSLVTQYYDPMIAKLICWGSNRTEACLKTQQSLNEYTIGGIKTNIAFLKAITHQEDFLNAVLSTSFLTTHALTMPKANVHQGLIACTMVDYAELLNTIDDPIFKDTFAFRMVGHHTWIRRYQHGEEIYSIKITAQGKNHCTIEIDQQKLEVSFSYCLPKLTLQINGVTQHYLIHSTPQQITVFSQEGPLCFERYTLSHQAENSVGKHPKLTAPMPSTVVAILKKKGEQVKAGDKLVVLEAMKMEHTMTAPIDGFIKEVFYDAGAQVSEGAQIVLLEGTLENEHELSHS